LTNTGNAALNISGITFTAGAFTQANDCGSSIAAGATCTITVTFRPTAGLSYDATMSIADSSPDSPQGVALHGFGISHHGPFAGGIAAALTSSNVNAVPRPSGSHVVGTRVVDLVDVTREDPYLANGTKRELMVRLWYPAASGEACKPAEYAPAKVWARFGQLLALPLAEIRTNSCADATVAEGEHPVVLFTPGYTATFTDYTFLFEDLASRGYVVASVDHTHEATAVEFLDGRFVPSMIGSHLGGKLIDDSETLKFAVETRLGDLKFVGRELTRMNNDPRGAFLGRLDTSRIALAGHSLGGWTALRGVNEEPTFKVGVALDPSVFAGLGMSTEKPVLLMGAGRVLWTADENELWARLRGPRFAVNLLGAEHKAPSDAVWLARYAIQTGRLSPQQMIATVRDYVAAFLDESLRGGEPGSLLKGRSPHYPDTVVTTQEQQLQSKN
jgi:pimeloyl-ACP methyl ester carboxylesterase